MSAETKGRGGAFWGGVLLAKLEGLRFGYGPVDLVVRWKDGWRRSERKEALAHWRCLRRLPSCSFGSFLVPLVPLIPPEHHSQTAAAGALDAGTPPTITNNVLFV